MIRKQLLAVLILLATAVFGVPSATSMTAPAFAPLQEPAPNVVLMIVDDATVEDIEYMPAVQRLLVQSGTTFVRNYSPFPLCCPARATLLTGQYPHNHQVLDNVPPIGGASVFDDSQTIATYLTDDYDTALVGKYLNGFEGVGVPPGWDTWRAPIQHTVYDYLNQVVSLDGTAKTFSNTYSTTHYTDMARTFIRNANRPYFAYVSWVAPHGGTPQETRDDPPSPYVQKRYRDTYTGPPLPRDPAFNEADMRDKRRSFRKQPFLTRKEITRLKEKLAQRRESLQSVDDGVSDIVREVANAGELDNTYFMFVSDNGQMQGQHRTEHGKAVAYEPAARVPLIIRGPGVAAGATYDNVTGLQDITPTILSMTNQWHDQPEAQIDGVSLLRLLDGSLVTDRAQVLEVTDTASLSDRQVENGATPTRQEAQALSTISWQVRAIVTSDGWKYTVYPRTDEVEMYDLNADPFELQNIAGVPKYKAQQARLDDLYLRYRNCDGERCW